MGPRDSNFVEQLQTTAFDQRVFELALGGFFLIGGGPAVQQGCG